MKKRKIQGKITFDKVISTAWIVLIALLCASLLAVFTNSVFDIFPEKEQEEQKETLEGKYISFFGDSITTYAGWSNNTSYNTTIGSNAVHTTYYTGGALATVDETYWKRTVDNLGLNLCVNNAWAGSRVTGNGVVRATELHNNVKNIDPDIIVVYFGINDFNGGVACGSFTSVDDIYNESTKTYTANLNIFANAYATMVHKMKMRYPDADIYLCTLDYCRSGLEDYNGQIKKIAEAMDCNLVDFYNDTPMNLTNISTYTPDKLHPNALGMEEMYKCLKAALQKNYN